LPPASFGWPQTSKGSRQLQTDASDAAAWIPGAFAGGMARSQGSFAMRRTLVRYRTHPDRAEENQHLIEKVFQELRAGSPDGLRYLALKLDDGTFVHFVTVETADGANPLPSLESFQAFQHRIKERCIDQPQAVNATIVGNYRMLGES
jgi:hypothetical protein